MAGLSRKRARVLLAGAAFGGALAVGTTVAMAADPPGGLGFNPPASSPSNAANWTFNWNPAVGADSYEGGLVGGAVTNFGTATTSGSIAVPEGQQTFRVRSVEGGVPSAYATVAFTVDRTSQPPTITGGPAVNNSWVKTPPDSYTINEGEPGSTINWTLNGPIASPLTGSGPTGLKPVLSGANNTSTSPYILSATAVDALGNPASATSNTKQFRLDQIAPSISAVFSSPPNALGWWKTNVGVTFNCSDTHSGVPSGSCTGSDTLTSHTDTVPAGTGNATDRAGNSTSSGVVGPINIDKEDPNDTEVTGPTNGSKTNLVRPTFTWNPTTDNGPSDIQDYDVVIDGNVEATVSAGGPYSFTPSSDMSETGHSWFVRAHDKAGNAEDGPAANFEIDTTAPPKPTITSGPPNPTNSTSATFSWTGIAGVTGYRWKLVGPSPQGPFEVPGTTTSVTVSVPANGTYAFILEQKTFGDYGTETSYPFRVDTIAPAQPVLVSLPPDSSTDTTPTFSWVGEPLGLYRWQVLSGGNVVQQGDSLASQVTVAPLAPGAYVFQVRQTDDAGNIGPFSPQDGFSIVAPTPTTPTASTTTKTTTKTTTATAPAVENARRLKPKAGAVVTTRRPTLRWNRRAGATIYNVQIFELNGRDFRKVLSRFPLRNSYRVPAGKLRYGKRYVWRVWPFLGAARAAAPKAVGVSYFDVRRPKLSAVLAKRLLTPRATRFKKAKKLTVRWKPRRGSRFYRVEFRRNKKVVVRNGKRIVQQRAKLLYRTTERRRRAVIPAKHLRVKGSYTIVVRAGRGKLRNRYHRVTWARGTVIRV